MRHPQVTTPPSRLHRSKSGLQFSQLCHGMYPRPPDLLSLEEKDRAVAEVKVYEVLGF
jgi:hypothetical protein